MTALRLLAVLNVLPGRTPTEVAAYFGRTRCEWARPHPRKYTSAHGAPRALY